jgi:hypothetical protein
MQRSATTLCPALLAFFLGFALTLGAQTSGAPQFSNTSINATVGEVLPTTSLNATNSPISYNGNLPDGLDLSSSGNITGTPFVAGNFTVVVSASNNSGSTTANLTITIAKGTPTLVTPPSIVLYTGEILADTSPEDGLANIAGLFEFEDPSSQPTSDSVNVVFTPFESDNWDPTTFSVPVSVVASPVYDLDLSANLQQIFEGDPYSEARIRITHNGTTSRAITVNFTATSASLQGDMSGDLTFVDFPTSATIPAGSNSTVFYVRAKDDQSYTGNRTIILTGAGQFLGSNTTSLTVLDDETSFGSWSNNSSFTPQLLQSYAIGGSVHGQPGEPPFLTMNSTHAALDAIIRTKDPALRITGEYTADLKIGPWTEVTDLSLHSDQSGLTDGFERHFFSIPIQAGETKKFLRLKIELQD